MLRIKDINTRSTAICEDCFKKMSGHMPYFGFSCDGCVTLEEMMSDG